MSDTGDAPTDAAPGSPRAATAAFVAQLARHQDRLHAYIFTLLPNAADAQDVFQRTSLILWNKFALWDPGSSFMSWASTVAFYEVRNFLRLARRREQCFGDDLLAKLSDERLATLEGREERLTALVGCLERLGGDDRLLVERVYREGRSIKEVAGELGRAAQTLYNRLNQLRRRLLLCVDARLAGEEQAR